MKPNSLPTTTPDSQIQDNPSVSHTEQPQPIIPTLPGLPNPDFVDPSLILTFLVSLTAKVLFPCIAACLKPQKAKLNPDKKDSIVFNFFTFNQVVNIPKENDDLPNNKTLKEKDDLPNNKTLID